MYLYETSIKIYYWRALHIVKRKKFWRHDNKPIELWSNKVIKQKIDYIHDNPVEAGLVFNPEDYVYSGARDYSGEKGFLDDVVVFRMFDV